MEMSTYNHFLELSNQLCYVQCSYCTTVLLVNVPCNSLLKMVTVRCGHCTGLLSVNMMKASFLPLQFLASLDDIEKQDLCEDFSLKSSNGFHPLTPSLDNGEEKITVAPTINKPPEKRQRAPSAYNRFIKEEIQRLKAREPNITHKEAFSTAAKNWAHFPRIQYKGDGESCNREMGAAKMTAARGADAAQGNVQCKGIDEMKATRHSLWTKTPLE